ncbi:MAG: tellurium resistance protein TerC [Aliarcobacter butzleri]|nr:MAG: tellurium resistance protein TerC [Aliarcobacter butzleri]
MIFISRFSGLLIFFSFITTVYSYFFQKEFLIVSGILAWSASALLFFTLKYKKILLILLVLSFFAFLFSYINGFKIDFIKAFTVNQYLLTLLIAVGFLKLIATPRKEKIQNLPKGKKSFIKTYLSVHLFGSVINISSLLLIADKMYKRSALNPAQIVLLTRAFASDAYWSPFFVAFAAAITYAPNLQTYTIISFGIFLAVIAFVITYFDVTKDKKFNIDEFNGYPLSLETLYLPIILAIFVLTTHYFYPTLEVIVLISTFSILMTFSILPLKKGFLESLNILKYHIIDELPKMKSEISLFLVAGLFGILIGSVLIGLNFTLPFEIFDYKIASILLLIFILLAFVGIHPIITIAIIGDFFVNANHTLLAMTFLMAWSTTVSTSPISGLNLTIVARYNCSAKEIFMLNIFYALKMYIVCVICLFILSKYLNI